MKIEKTTLGASKKYLWKNTISRRSARHDCGMRAQSKNRLVTDVSPPRKQEEDMGGAKGSAGQKRSIYLQNINMVEHQKANWLQPDQVNE